MRAKAVQLALVVLCALAAGFPKDEPIDALKARAARENEPRLYAEAVRRQVEVANDHYTAGEVEKAQDVIRDIVDLTRSCVETAHKNHSRLKDTELTLYKAAKRLEDVRRSLNFDDQPPVKDAVDHIQKARRELLDLMFRPPKKDKDKP